MHGGRTDALSVYLLWMQVGIKSKTLQHRLNRWSRNQSTGAMKVLCSREHVLMDSNFSSAPVEPTLRNQSTGAMKVLCSGEHVLMDSNYSSAPVEPTVQNQSTGALEVLCSRTLV